MRARSRTRCGLALITALLVLGLLGTAVFWLVGHQRADLVFFARGPGEWIVPPLPPETGSRSQLPLEATFRASFDSEGPGGFAGQPVWLKLRAYGSAEIAVNGRTALQLSDTDRPWKRVTTVDVTGLLQPGANRVTARVLQSRGPPAVCLSVSSPESGELLRTDESWEVSLVGSSWRPVRLARQHPPLDPGLAGEGGSGVGEAFRRSLPLLLLFAVVSALLVAGLRWFEGRPKRRTAGIERFLPPILAGLLWIVLYINNADQIQALVGFDAIGHLDYIEYILERHSLPLAGDGWQMYQPPLFYLLCSGILSLLHLTLSDPSTLLVIRGITFTAGIVQILLLGGIARLLWPERRMSWLLALIFAAFLPMHLSLFHYVSNETLAMVLCTAVSLLSLRLLTHDSAPSFRSSIALGACFGLAMLAKFSALVLAPVVAGAFIIQLHRARAGWRKGLFRVSAALASCLILCGWHYLRVWSAFGTPIIGNWDPSLGFSWWQDPGYRVAGDYLRFGGSVCSPWFAGFLGVPDGLFSTMWGDGLAGGAADLRYGPPWNRGLMATGYVLALLPSAMIAIGFLVGLCRLLRGRLTPNQRPAAVYLCALSAVVVSALLYMTLKVPSYAQAKAFYAHPALPALCAAFVVGATWLFDRLRGRFRSGFQVLLLSLIGVWAMGAYGSVWVIRSSPETDAQIGIALMAEGDFPGAERRFRSALRRDPDHGSAWFGLLQVHLGRNDWPGLRAAALKAAETNPDTAGALFVEILIATAHADLEARNYRSAELQLRRALRLNPVDPRSYEMLASLLREQSRFEAAIAVLRDELAVLPTRRFAHEWLAYLYRATSQHEQCIQQLQFAMRLYPKDPQLGLGLIEAYASLGRMEEAITAAGRLLEAAERSGQRRLAEELRSRIEDFAARSRTTTNEDPAVSHP